MAAINTRNHIVLDKESLQKYAASLGTECIVIFEIDLKEDVYGTLIQMKKDELTAESGSRSDLLEGAENQIHKDDLQRFRALFEKQTLWNIVSKGGYESLELRCLDGRGEYRWMRIAVTADEVEKNTVLCFITDIDAKKRCEFLEKRNAELCALVSRLSSSQTETENPRGRLINIADFNEDLVATP